MKKLIALLLSIFTILLVSTSAFAATVIIDWGIVSTVHNIKFNSQEVVIARCNTSSPTPDMTYNGTSLTQKTTYNTLLALYESLTVGDVTISDSTYEDGQFEWYKYGSYYWIKYNVDRDTRGYYIGNYQGKILYCDAPTSETTYSVVAIAGVSNYYLTNRPAGTTGTGYLGDLYLTYDNWLNIQSTLNNLTGDKSYYTYGHSINGEFRYYLANRPSTTTYYVCNSAGQLFYTIKDTGSSEDTGGGGSTFDPTEVITAINSVYDAINSQGSRFANGLSQLTITANTISDILNLHMNNVVDGFGDIQNSLSTLNSYFTDLSGLFPVQETITLLGSDTRVAWDSADRITNVSASGFTGDLIVKEHSGPLIDESGYEKVTLSPDTTEYRLYNDADGYRRIVAQNEYPDTGSVIPENTLFYFSFDNSLSSTVGGFDFNCYGTPSYASGISGDAFKFNGSTYLATDNLGRFVTFSNNSFSFSYWVYITGFPSVSYETYCFDFGDSSEIWALLYPNGLMSYSFRPATGASTRLQGTISVPLNTWTNIAFTYTGGTGYCFVNGQLDATGSMTPPSSLSGTITISEIDTYFKAGSMLDEFIFVNGSALWTSSFDAEKEAIFSAVAADYFLPCNDQAIGLVFDDTINQTLSPTDVNGNAITMGRLEDDFSEIYMDISTMMWYCHDPQTQTEILLSSANQQIMNDTIYVRQNYTMLPADQITADALQNLLPVDSPVYLDMPEGAKLTITYDHYTGWFRMMYILMDKQTKLLSDLDIVNETIINVENIVIDITNSNPAYNVFYITKTDGTTESVGDAAKDAAVFVGDILSMFYRLVFDDALDNVGILNDFEGAYSNTEVSVW